MAKSPYRIKDLAWPVEFAFYMEGNGYARMLFISRTEVAVRCPGLGIDFRRKNLASTQTISPNNALFWLDVAFREASK